MEPDKTPELPAQVWTMMQETLGYNEEEIEQFRQNPRNVKVVSKAMEMRAKTFVFEVVKSKGCLAGHKEGTKVFFTGNGLLISKWAPPRICTYALPMMTQMIFAMQELIYAGVDPNELCFNRAGCFDVGLKCGGWGNVVIEGRVLDREAAKALAQQD